MTQDSPLSESPQKLEVQTRLDYQIRKGKELLELLLPPNEQNHDTTYMNEWGSSLQHAEAEVGKWHKLNISFLNHHFEQTVAEEYEADYTAFYLHFRGNPYALYKDGILKRIMLLESFYEQLEYGYLKLISSSIVNQPGESNLSSNTVFIVHGHDSGLKNEVARLIEGQGLKATILHEQTNQGATTMEKLETHGKEAGFAVVLLTPDDLGGKKSTPTESHPRARQNVIFELGYFLGALGRNRVCVIHKESVELPSDYQGILYISYDERGAWKHDFIKEMKDVGLQVSLDKVR